MTCYAGPPLCAGDVVLVQPSHDLGSLADDMTWLNTGGERTSVRDAIVRWTAAARDRDDILMFEITERGASVGQIFLHDIDATAGQAMVGYHLVAQHFRGRGVGSKALQLLVDFVRVRTDLSNLVITTAGDNAASQRIAAKAGFELVGAPWEDPTACLFKLSVGRRTS